MRLLGPGILFGLAGPVVMTLLRFPNLGAAAVPAFGGCMLICCGGGLAGAVWPNG